MLALEMHRCRVLAEGRQEFFDKDRQSETGYARARRRLGRVGLTSKMSSRPRRGNGRSSRWGSRGSLVSQREQINRKEPDMAGKKRPKSLAQTGTKAPAKTKRPKKTSRGK
jgi:hypothetical protein